MKFVLGSALALSFLTLSSAPAVAAPLVLTPDDLVWAPDGFPNSNCAPDCLEEYLGLPAGTFGDAPLYKSDFGGNDSGTYADSYDTEFGELEGDPPEPGGATITYVGGPTIECPACFLAVKDGNQTPSWYFYDLSLWDGEQTIQLSGLWPEKGAISNLQIWGYPAEEEGGSEEEGTGEGEEEEGGQEEEGTTVPEPASMILLGLGMAAAAARLRQRTR